MTKSKKISIFDKIIITIICLILFSGSSILSTYKYQLIILLTALVIISSLKDFKISYFRIHKYNGLLVILNVVFALTCFISINKVSSLQFVAFFAMMTLISLILKRDKNFFIALLNSIEICSIIVAISIFISVVDKDFIINNLSFLLPQSSSSLQVYKNELINGNYSGIMFERAYAATGITLGISVIISKMVTSKKIKKQEMFILVILLLALFATGKRMLLFINLFNLLFLFFVNNPLKKGTIKKILILTVVGIVVLIVSLIIFPDLGRVFERLTQSSDTLSTRSSTYWVYCIEMFKSRPILGYGINSFTSYISNFDISEVYNAHNIYLQLMGETGIIGFLIFLILLIWCICVSLKTLISSSNDDSRYLISAAITLQSTFCIYGLSGNTLYYLSQLFFLFISFSIINNVLKEDRDEKRSENINIS